MIILFIYTINYPNGMLVRIFKFKTEFYFINQIEASGYALKFDGKNRVTKASIKNFVMVIENDERKYFL